MSITGVFIGMKYTSYVKHCLGFLGLLVLMSTECEEQLSQAMKLYNGGDITAPMLTDIKANTGKRFIMEFNETLSTHRSSFEIDNNMAVKSIGIQANQLIFELDKDSDPGKEYTISATVQDTVGNTALIVEKIYGFNPIVPGLLIHEFTTEGSKKNPDKIEILVLSQGNTAGVTLQEGGIYRYKQRIVFPAIQVQKGDFIVVHFRAPADAQSETKSKTESQLKIAYEDAWDIFHSHPKMLGIGNTSSALVLLKNPHGDPIDAVIYSNKEDDATKEDRGFANKHMYAWVREIEEAKMWKGEEVTKILPSHTINPTDSTSTRSINRKGQRDTDSADDWYIVNTRKASFGRVNSQEVYVPRKKKKQTKTQSTP